MQLCGLGVQQLDGCGDWIKHPQPGSIPPRATKKQSPR